VILRATKRICAFIFPALLLLLPLQGKSEQTGNPLDLLPSSLRTFLDYEQKHMSLSVDPTRINMGTGNKQDLHYAPENGNVFDLKSYWVKADDLHVFESEVIDEKIRKTMFMEKDGVKFVRFFVHPESESLYENLLKNADSAGSYHATATSSSRSLLVWRENETPFIAKVSLNKEVSAVVRNIPKSEISRSIGTNNTLLTSKDQLPKNFDWMQESLATIPKGMERGGLIIRELPHGLAEGTRTVIPLFALYGGNSARGPPLLAKMIKQSGEPASVFIKNRILDPFIKMWLSTTIDNGFSMEAHAQNTLIELDEHGLPNGKFVFRDLGGFDVDFAYRKKIGAPLVKSLPFVDDFNKEYHQYELQNAIRGSLYNHFEGGFVYNLDQYIPEWMGEGLINQEKLGNGFFSHHLMDSFEKNYALRVGKKVEKMGSIVNCDRYVLAARERLLKNLERKNAPPSRWSCIKGIFGLGLGTQH